MRTFLILLILIFGANNLGLAQIQFSGDSLWNREVVKEHLVKVAWENSGERKNNLVSEDLLEVDANRKFRWLDGLSVGSNINEFTLNPPPNQNNFFPRYNFGFRLSYGQINDIFNGNEKTRIQLESIKHQLETDSVKLRADVLRSFETFKLMEDLLKISQEKQISVKAELDFVEKEFTAGNKDLDEYNDIQDLFKSANENVLRAKYNYAMARINLEEIIGMDYEDAIALLSP